MDDVLRAKVVRRLMVAIVALAVIVLGVKVAPAIWNEVVHEMHFGDIQTGVIETAPAPKKIDKKASTDDEEDFKTWPIEKQIASASAIILTKNSANGVVLSSTVSEILKLVPGTKLPFKVGDKYENGLQFVMKDPLYGDGDIVFFTGTTARKRFAINYFDITPSRSGNMRIETFREIFAAQPNPSSELSKH